MKIIVGLGNIGKEYEKTRHNCGFMVLDEFAKTFDELEWKEEPKFKALIAKTEYEGEKLLLVKPTTFMNLSGESVSKILSFYKEPVDNLIVISDDIDLPLGKIRVREKGSAGTHNGLKSIIEALSGSERFKRIRVGIESRTEENKKKQDLTGFVLGKFTKEELPKLHSAIKESIETLKNSLT